MDFKERYKIIILIFMIGTSILVANLFYLQVISKDYQNQARNHTLTKRTLFAPRGTIYDRNGELLVVNQPSYELEIIFNELDPEMDVAAFCRLLDLTENEYDKRIKDVLAKPYFIKSLPIPFLKNIAPEYFAVFQEHLYNFPGFYVQVKNKRIYPYPFAAHTVGFISEVNSKDIKNSSGALQSGEYKGASGIELTYDADLRGSKGFEYFLKDNLGREVESFQQGHLDSMSAAGDDLTLTLDIDLQALGEELLENKKGSIVALSPKSGEILAMVTSPSYDPNELSLGRQRNQTYFELLTDTVNQPLFNRSFQAKYPPGSIFKPILSLIALQQGITYANRTILCSGEYVINEQRGFSQGCRDHPTPHNIEMALQYSCNTYYYQVIREFIDQFGYNHPGQGLALLNSYLTDFGLGHRLGIDLSTESPGFLPTPKYYDALYNNKEYSWKSTYILSLGIGQGELELTTLQMANLAAILANRGYYYVPHMVKKLASGKEIPNKYKIIHTVPIDSVHFISVINGMERVITGGSGYLARVGGVPVCGKTGTSQNPHGKDHSVFYAFAPKENPTIAVAVYIENAGGGGQMAAPIGGLMIEKYIVKTIPSNRKPLLERIKNIDLIKKSNT